MGEGDGGLGASKKSVSSGHAVFVVCVSPSAQHSAVVCPYLAFPGVATTMDQHHNKLRGVIPIVRLF